MPYRREDCCKFFSIKLGSTLHMSELASYRKLGKIYNHQVVNHSAWGYAKGQALTSNIDGGGL